MGEARAWRRRRTKRAVGRLSAAWGQSCDTPSELDQLDDLKPVVPVPDARVGGGEGEA